MIKYFLVFLFFLLVLTECVGDMCFHKSIHGKKNKHLFLGIGLGMSVIMGLLYYKILQNYDNLAVPNAIYQCLSVLAVTLGCIKREINITKTFRNCCYYYWIRINPI